MTKHLLDLPLKIMNVTDNELAHGLKLRAIISMRRTYSLVKSIECPLSVADWIPLSSVQGDIWIRIVSCNGLQTVAANFDDRLGVLRQITLLEPLIAKFETMIGRGLQPTIVQSLPANMTAVRVEDGELVADLLLPLEMVLSFDMPNNVQSEFSGIDGEIIFDVTVAAPSLTETDIQALTPGDLILWPESLTALPAHCVFQYSAGKMSWAMSARFPELLPSTTNSVSASALSLHWHDVRAPMAVVSGQSGFTLSVEKSVELFENNELKALLMPVPFGNMFALLVEQSYT
jgi:hypothetical protein